MRRRREGGAETALSLRHYWWESPRRELSICSAEGTIVTTTPSPVAEDGSLCGFVPLVADKRNRRPPGGKGWIVATRRGNWAALIQSIHGFDNGEPYPLGMSPPHKHGDEISFWIGLHQLQTSRAPSGRSAARTTTSTLLRSSKSSRGLSSSTLTSATSATCPSQAQGRRSSPPRSSRSA